MRRTLGIVRLILRDRAWTALIPVLAALAVGLLIALLLVPAAAARGDAQFAAHDAELEQRERDRAGGQAPADHPDFTIAVGIDDEPMEMPALQSAMTDHLSFAEEFAERLKTGAVAADFATHERVMSPASARAQVADGTSALAIVFPKDFTRTLLAEMNERGLAGAHPKKYRAKVEVLAGPQTRTQNDFVLNEYRTQVMNQALEFSRDQIHTEAQRWTCQDSRTAQTCKASPAALATAFDQAFAFTVVEAKGPAPQDYRYASLVAAESTGTEAAPGSAAAAPASADLRASRHVYSLHSASLTAIPVALAAAALVLGIATSIVVDRNVGIGMWGFGPWRRWGRQRPLSRTAVLSAKMWLCTAGAVVLALAGALWAAGAGAAGGFGPFFPHGATELIAWAARLAVFCAAGLLIAWLVVGLIDVLGGLAGGVATALLSVWVLLSSGVVPAVGGGVTGSGWVGSLVGSVALGFSPTSYRAVGIPGFALVCIALIMVGAVAQTIVRLYDRKVSIRIG